MALDIRGIPNVLFENSKEENLGIAAREKELTQVAIKSFEAGGISEQYDVSNNWAEIDGMGIEHTSKTGKVLIIFTCSVSVGSIIGDNFSNYTSVDIKLEKDGNFVDGTWRQFYIRPQGEENNSLTCAFQIIDTNVEKNYWSVKAKQDNYGDDDNDSFIDDRVLTIIDL